MKLSLITLSVSLLLSSAYASECAKPNEFSASAFNIISTSTGSRLMEYLQTHTVARKALNEDCEDMYQLSIRTRNESARSALESIGYGPKTAEELNLAYTYALRFSPIPVIKEFRDRGGRVSGDEIAIAAANNSYEVIEWLLGKKELTDNQFAQAVLHNKIEVIDRLIRRGGNVSGENVLAYALYRSDKAVLELLIRAGTDVNVKIYDLYPTLQVIAASGSVEIFELFRNAGASMDVDLFPAAIKSGSVKMMKHLVSLGLSLDYADENGANLFHLSVKAGKTEIAEYLLTEGLAVNSTDSEGKNAFAYVTDLKVANWLSSKGCDINGRNIYNETNLMTAAKNQSAPQVELLLKAGANVNLLNSDGDAAIHLAFKPTKTFVRPEVVTALINGGTGVNMKNKAGYSPLLLAAAYADVWSGTEERKNTMIVFLMKKGADKTATVKVNGKKMNAYALYVNSVRYTNSIEVVSLLK